MVSYILYMSIYRYNVYFEYIIYIICSQSHHLGQLLLTYITSMCIKNVHLAANTNAEKT